MFDLDLALTIAVSIILLLAGGVSVYALPWRDEDLMQASSGVTGVINLGLICFSGLMLLGMMLS